MIPLCVFLSFPLHSNANEDIFSSFEPQGLIEGEPSPRSSHYLYLYPKSCIVTTPSTDGSTFAIPAESSSYTSGSSTTNGYNITPPSVSVNATSYFVQTGTTPYSLGLRSGMHYSSTNFRFGGPLRYVYAATFDTGEFFYLLGTNTSSEILMPTPSFSVALLGYYVVPAVSSSYNFVTAQNQNRHLSFTLEMDLSNYSNIPLKYNAVYDVILYTNWGPPIWDLSGFQSLSGNFTPYPIVSSGGTPGNAFISKQKNNRYFLSGTAQSTVVTDVYNLNNDKKYWVSFSFDIPVGCSAYMNNTTLVPGTVGLLFQESQSSVITTDLESAGGQNDALNNQNQQVENTFSQYEQVTDTKEYYDKIDTNLLNFDISIFTQIAATSTLFSSLITMMWSAMGNLAVPLTLFLVAALASLVVGIFRNAGD